MTESSQLFANESLKLLIKRSRSLVPRVPPLKFFAYEVSGQFQILAKDPKSARMSTTNSTWCSKALWTTKPLQSRIILIDQLSPSSEKIRAMILKMKEDSEAKVYIGGGVQNDLVS